MPIHFASEDAQSVFLSNYNNEKINAKKRFEKIPVVPRNIDSGWPLLQVSLFSVSPTSVNPIKYEPALGGGKCHFFFTGAFCLASLLSKVPGKINFDDRSFTENELNGVSIANVSKHLDEFKFEHVQSGIVINQASGGYGKTLEVRIPDSNANALQIALYDSFLFALKPKLRLSDFDTFGNKNVYTASDINNALNQDIAIFKNGQIFVDLGKFLEVKVKDDEIVQLFKQMFKVDEFLKIVPEHFISEDVSLEATEEAPAEQLPKVDALPDIMSEHSIQKPQEAPYNSDNTIGMDRVYFSNALKDTLLKIQAMKQFGQTLEKEDPFKGSQVIKLANKLESKINTFYINVPKNKSFNETDVNQLNKEFTHVLHSQDGEMSAHRNIWKPIVLNLLIGLTIIGALAIAIKTAAHVISVYKNDEKITLNKSLFFATTTSEQHVNDIEESFKSELTTVSV